jgi:hypothetical protein
MLEFDMLLTKRLGDESTQKLREFVARGNNEEELETEDIFGRAVVVKWTFI